MRDRRKRYAALAAAAMIALMSLASCGDADTTGDHYINNETNAAEDINGGEYISEVKGAERIEDAELSTEAEYFDGMGDINTEEYMSYIDNDFLAVSEHPLSTFSTDVDTASFTNVRRMIMNGLTVDPDAVRTEEFINYFDYSYPAPQGEDKISITTELTACPWNKESQLMLVGLQAKEIDTSGVNSNIVFLIDVSGSMESEDKLPLVRQAFTMLSEQLGQNDRISIVTYAGSDRVVLEGENGGNFQNIKNALDSLSAGGSTAGAAGITTAYDIASKYFIEGGNNRVILATDGDLNVGLSSRDELIELIESERDKGIFLSVLGFGAGNYKDSRLEALADNGNGNYSYIDSVDEAERVLVKEFAGTMFTVAKDAKVQIEFDPNKVSFYKLVGYENRLLNDEDFEDDTKDAGDIGSGQQVTALYEIITTQRTDEIQEEQENDRDGQLLTVSVRYKEPDEDESRLISKPVFQESYRANMDDLDEYGDDMRLACAAAMFSKTLRGTAQFTAEDVYEILKDCGLDHSDLDEVMEKYFVD